MKHRSASRRAAGRVAAAVRFVRLTAASAARRKTSRVLAFELVKNSGLFDPQWYLRAYPDIATARIDPLQHYMIIGWREGRDPGPEFASGSYLKANPDVAAAGVNPLLHFIEFGYFEGRGSSAYRPVPKQFKAPTTEFRPAAECVSFLLRDEPPIRWRRVYRLHPGPHLFSVGDCAVGYAPDAELWTTLKSSFSLVQSLSGYGEAGSRSKARELPQAAERLLDAWYVNSAQLRTRWHAEEFPVVVRAFQHDPLREGALTMVGEGLAASPIDAVDLHLRNPLFPVLLVFAAPDGTVRGASMLAFPSLCRGGLHYAELLQSSAGKVNPAATGELLASRLLDLAAGSSTPAIGQIEVDIGDADGRGELFQSDLQLWLEKVVKIGVAPVGSTNSSAANYLAEALTVQTSSGRRPDGATLTIGHEVVPTIGALTEPHQPGESGVDQISLPLLVAGSDPSQPAIAIELPREEVPALDRLAGARSPWWPRLKRRAKAKLPDIRAAAISLCGRRTVSDARLFVPVADGLEAARLAISWVVDTRGWSKGGLAQAVHALSLQNGGGDDCLCFLGAADPLAQSVAGERFAGRVTSSDKIEAAIAAAQRSVIGFAGAGVILHDRRCAAVLAGSLEDERIATASCAIVEVKQSGVGWNAVIADGGSFARRSGARLGRPEREAVVEALWGSSYPVALPGRHLWLARKSLLTDWLEESRRQLGNRLHICSSVVTASHVGKDSPAQVPAFMPRAADERVTQVRALFG